MTAPTDGSSGDPVRRTSGRNGCRASSFPRPTARSRWGARRQYPIISFDCFARGLQVFLVTHERVKPELEAAFPTEAEYVFFTADGVVQKLLWRAECGISGRLWRDNLEMLRTILVQTQQRRLIRRLVRSRKIDVVHQPYPVSPVRPSMIVDVGAPVVIGPMNGGIDYPPAFRDRQGWSDRLSVALGQWCRHAANRLFPGKLKARVLLVANARHPTISSGPAQGSGR